MSILFGQGPVNQSFDEPTIVAQRAPGNGDLYNIGQFWIDVPNNDVYTLTSYSGGVPNWESTAGGAGLFSSIVVDPGPTTIVGITNINATGAAATTIGNVATGGVVTIESSGIVDFSTDNLVLDAAQAIIDVTTSLTFGNDATISTVDIVNVTPTVARTTTINGGAVITAVADTLTLASGGVNTNAGASKTVNIAPGDNLLGTQVVNIGTGIVDSGTHDINIGTGTGGGTKRVDVGNIDGLTAITEYGTVNINTATSPGATSIGNNSAGGAVAIQSTGIISLLSNDSVAGAISIRATGAAGTIQIAPDDTTTEVDIANVVPIATRLTYINNGTVATGVTDGVYIGNGATSNAGASKFVDICGGDNTLGSVAVDIATGTTATGSKTVTVGNADALTAINLTGVIALDGGTTGAVSVVNVQVATAAPGPAATASATCHARVGSVTFSGYTQAASATMVLTLTNSFIAANSCILATATNVGANDAQMNVSRIFYGAAGAGTVDITIVNNGAAALNGDMQLNFWVLS